MANETFGPIVGRITLDNKEFTVALKQVEKETDKTAKKTEKAGARSGKGFRDGARGVKRFGFALRGLRRSAGVATRALRSVGRALTSVRSLLAAVGAGFAAFKLFSIAAQVNDTELAFSTLVRTLGSDAVTALARFRTAARGTVADLDLMKQVNTAVILGVGKNVEEFERLIDAARRLGKATGRTAAQGFEDLVVGIGRQSRLILDNLGLIIKVGEANEAWAKSIGKTVDQLTAQEQRAGFQAAAFKAIEERLEKLGDDTLNFADVFNQVRASISNFVNALAKRATPALERFLKSLQDTFGDASFVNVFGDAISRVFIELAKFFENQSKQIIFFLSTLVSILSILSDLLGVLLREFTELLIEIQTAKFDKFQARLKSLETGLGNIFVGFGKAAGTGFALVLVATLKAILPPLLSAIPFLDANVVRAIELDLENATIRLGNAAKRGFFQGLGGIGGLLGIPEKEIEELFERIKETFKAGEEIQKGTADATSLGDTAITLEETLDALMRIQQELRGTASEIAASDDAMIQLRDDFLTLEAAVKSSSLGQKTIDALLTKLKIIFPIYREILKVRRQQLEEEEKLLKLTEEARENLQGLRDEVAQAGAAAGLRIQLLRADDEEKEALKIAAVINTLRNSARLDLLTTQEINEFDRLLVRLRARLELEADIARLKKQQVEATKRDTKAAKSLEKRAKAILALQKDVADFQIDADRIKAPTLDEQLGRDIADLTAVAGGLDLKIDSLQIGPGAKEELSLQVQEALQQGIDNLEFESAKEKFAPLADSIATSLEDAGRGLIDALERGESVASAIGSALASQLDVALSDVFANLRTGLKDFFATVAPGISEQFGKLLGTLASAAIGIIGAIIQNAQSRGSSTRELPIDELQTSTAAVRGVIAGPVNVPIAEVGSAISQAFRGSEALLETINQTLLRIEGSSPLGALGVGAAGS